MLMLIFTKIGKVTVS